MRTAFTWNTVFLVILILTFLVLLPARSSAHTQTFTCPSLPTEGTDGNDFFTGDALRAIGTTQTGTLTPTRGGGSGTPAQDGDDKYRYAKITVPPFAAGELRIAGAHSNAVLCHDGREHARYRVSYQTHAIHDRAENAARQAERDQTTATNASTNAGETNANIATARSALRAAADDIRNAIVVFRAAEKALTDAGDSTNAGAVTAFITAAEGFETAARTPTLSDPPVVSDYPTPLETAASNLGTVAENLRTTATHIRAHENFTIRATVTSGDGEYVLVVDQDSTEDLRFRFHGVLSANRKGRVANEGNAQFHVLTATAPGLLTVTATSSGDLKGELYTGGTPIAATATPIAEEDGSGTTFTLATPLTLATAGTAESYTLAARSQTRGTIEYSLAVTFNVAQSTSATVPNNSNAVAAAPDWGDEETGTSIPEDEGTNTQIAPRPNANEQANQDVDVFVFTIGSDATASGLLTVNGNDGSGGTHAKTTGTLYGPRGAIATDSNSGPGGTHFGFENIPVKAGGRYAVRVTGTAGGGYTLQFDHSPVAEIPETQGTLRNNVGVLSGQVIATTSPGQPKKNRNRYLFDITDTGTLYLESGGNDDTLGTLYGPDGTVIKTDRNSGAGRNFRIVAAVQPGLYMLAVESESNAGVEYTLTANFVLGATDDEPSDTDTGMEPDPEPDPDDTGGTTTDGTIDPRGHIDEPGNGSFRSGIGIIRGWVCDAGGQDVAIWLTNTDTNRRVTLAAPSGSSRGDVAAAGVCDRRGSDFGFVVQFNFNLLAEGTYTVEAFVGQGRTVAQIGSQEGRGVQPQTNRFTVVRISDQETLTIPGEDIEDVAVPNFPRSGVTTILRWDNGSQNFEIVDIEQ